MSSESVTNTALELAMRFILHTNRSVFLTGKAGTGKTSFLKSIREQCSKKMAVVAPTGVAAINAGGVTIHTFFQLPLGAYVPLGTIPDAEDQLFNNRASLLRNLRFSQQKKELIRELELLVIDEVSMVRADVLDAIDAVLRYIRKNPLEVFGGLQVLLIGDLLQLPPVVQDREWVHLKAFYESPFFFDAVANKEARPFVIELNHIYRQTDPIFIDLLNKVRNNQLDQSGWHALHEHYQPGFSVPADQGFVTLSTHNNRADAINQAELAKIKEPLFRFEASITGEFSEKAFPAEPILELKKHAQVMFIKNDKGEFRRFYNGKIGVIEEITEEQVWVRFPNEPDLVELEKETWRNIRYKLDKVKDRVEEEELGTFSQFPIRLAWAITIHKSQGLTFEKAVVDAGAAFAPGQVYVALSRLTGLGGLILKTRIPPGAIQTDQRVVNYTNATLNEEQLSTALEQAEQEFVHERFLKCFAMGSLDTLTADWQTEIEKKTSLSKPAMIEALQECQVQLLTIRDLAEKTRKHFALQLNELTPERADYLYQRTNSAILYFKQLFRKLADLLHVHAEEMKKEARMTKYQRSISAVQEALITREEKLNLALPMAEAFKQGLAVRTIKEAAELAQQEIRRIRSPVTAIEPSPVPKEKTPRKEAGASIKETVDLLNDGLSVPEIAKQRSLANSTIESHLVKAVSTGALSVNQLVSPEVYHQVEHAIASLGSVQLGPIKELLGAGFSYLAIKAVLAHQQKAEAE